METQESISQWQIETFGDDSRNPKTMVTRTFEEMVELCHAAGLRRDDLMDIIHEVYNKDKTSVLAEEFADVAIMLAGTASCCWVDLQTVIDHKMEINRNRKWYRREDGHLQHKEGE